MLKNYVSLIIPFYNPGSLIERCLRSVLQQTYADIEVIVIDDGSTDGSDDIVKNFLSDSRVKFFQQNNLGVSTARNIGMENATGRYVAFVDSDDFLESGFVSRLVNSNNEGKINWVVSGLNYLRPYGESYHEFRKLKFDNIKLNNKVDMISHFFPFIDRSGFNNVCGKLYDLSIIRSNGIKFDRSIGMGEDTLFNLNYFIAIDSCAFINDCLYNYWFQVNYSSKKYDDSSFYKRVKILNQFEVYFKKMGLNVRELDWFFVQAAFSSYMSLFHNECQLSLPQKIRAVKEIQSYQRVVEARKFAKPSKIFQLLVKFAINTDSVFIILAFAKILRFFQHRIRRWT